MIKTIIEIIIYLLGIIWTLFMLSIIITSYKYIYDLGKTVDNFVYNPSISKLAGPMKSIYNIYNKIISLIKTSLNVLLPQLPVPNKRFNEEGINNMIPTIPLINIPSIPCTGLELEIPYVDPVVVFKCSTGTC